MSRPERLYSPADLNPFDREGSGTVLDCLVYEMARESNWIRKIINNRWYEHDVEIPSCTPRWVKIMLGKLSQTEEEWELALEEISNGPIGEFGRLLALSENWEQFFENFHKLLLPGGQRRSREHSFPAAAYREIPGDLRAVACSAPLRGLIPLGWREAFQLGQLHDHERNETKPTRKRGESRLYDADEREIVSFAISWAVGDSALKSAFADWVEAARPEITESNKENRLATGHLADDRWPEDALLRLLKVRAHVSELVFETRRTPRDMIRYDGSMGRSNVDRVRLTESLCRDFRQCLSFLGDEEPRCVRIARRYGLLKPLKRGRKRG